MLRDGGAPVTRLERRALPVRHLEPPSTVDRRPRVAAKDHIFLPNCDYSNLSRPIQAGTGVGGQAGGAAGGGGAPGACNNLVNSAQVIDKNHHAEAPPVMTGGTIADGTYFLTAMDKYNGETGTSTHQEVWVYSGNTIQVVQQDGTHFTLSYVAANNVLTYTITCPAAQAGVTGMSPYTATATQIVSVNSDDANELHTFTKQ